MTSGRQSKRSRKTNPPAQTIPAAQPPAEAVPRNRHNDSGKHQEQIIATAYSGPLPPAAEMRGFKEVDPGMPMRIIAMTEREQEWRHNFLQKQMSAEFRAHIFALAAITTVCISGMVAAVLIAIYANEWAGMALGAFVTVFPIVAKLLGTFAGKQDTADVSKEQSGK